KLTTRVLQERYPNVGYSLKIVKKVVHLFEDTSSVVKPKRVYHPQKLSSKNLEKKSKFIHSKFPFIKNCGKETLSGDWNFAI
ncbi:hypothetical protein BDFB_014967, partial [Asbolus verrucosus]